MGSPLSPGTSRSTKSQNKFKKEKRNLSYADLHSEVMNDANSMQPTPSVLHQKQQVRSKEIENEELVKYMSKLPGYLEKGEKVQDKPLNIGVLDWRSLENWQYYHSKMSSRSSRYSASSSVTSSSFSTDESANHYRRGHSCSPAGKNRRRPTLQSYLNISPVEGHFEFVQSSAGNARKFQDIKAVPSNPLDGQKNIPREYQFSNSKFSEIKLKECKKKNLDVQSIPKTRASRNFENYEASSSSKGKSKVRDDASTKESENLQNQYDNSIHHDSPERHKNVVLLLPRDGAGSKHSGISYPFGLTETNVQKSTESSQMISEGFHFEEVCHTKLCSSMSQSCPLPCEIHGTKESQTGQHISVSPVSVKFFHSPSSALKSVGPARNKIIEEKPSMMHVNSTVTKSLKGSDMKTSTVSATKVRNPSPTRRFSMSLDRIGRSSNSKVGAAIPQFSSNNVTAKSGAERADASACSNNSTSNKPNVVSRDRFSPLKRLLDPLLKPKAPNSHFAQQSQKDSTSTNRTSTSFDGPRESSSVNLVKVKLDLTSLRSANLDDSRNTEKQGSATLQAYLQIAVKNDLPLFTFAVDNNRDVLAATVRKFSSRKDDHAWIYTFFTIQEMKKKNGGWLSQGSKAKDYVPNVVAQMKVSDLQFSNLGGLNSADQLSTREYVLFAVDLRPFDQQTSDIQPNDELAAIVVKFLRSTITDLKESSQDVRGSSNSRNLQELFSTTVVLPGGVHGQPSKGEPSPLIERWLSGGLCDCGGWDLGCRVKVLGHQSQKPTGQFELFSQSKEEVLETRPFFTLSSLRNGIVSVEFDSSISLLQAFSICIAVIDGKKSSELQQPCNLFQEKLTEETTSLEYNGMKAPKRVQVDVPARYASHPPHSPVGRV